MVDLRRAIQSLPMEIPMTPVRRHASRSPRRLPLACAVLLLLGSGVASAQDAAALDAPADEPSLQDPPPASSGKLLLTGGVTQVEGAAGGGLTP